MYLTLNFNFLTIEDHCVLLFLFYERIIETYLYTPPQIANTSTKQAPPGPGYPHPYRSRITPSSYLPIIPKLRELIHHWIFLWIITVFSPLLRDYSIEFLSGRKKRSCFSK